MDVPGDIPKNWKAEYDVHVIPINIHFENEIFQQGVDLSDDDFYHIVETSGVIPKTSQSTPQIFVDFYKRLAQTSDTILSLHVTSKLSGTYNSGVLAAVVKIKPIIILKDGAVDMGEKVRTLQRAINRVLEIIHEQVGDRLINVAIVHLQSIDAAKDLLRKVRETFQVNEVILSDLSIGIAANLGPRTIGIVAYAVS